MMGRSQLNNREGDKKEKNRWRTDSRKVSGWKQIQIVKSFEPRR